MKKVLDSTMHAFEMADGSTVQMTLSFRRLMELKTRNKQQYENCNRIMMEGPKDIFDNVSILYTAYLCALDEKEIPMGYDAFVDGLPGYMNVVNEMVQDLIRPKKKTSSGNNS